MFLLIAWQNSSIAASCSHAPAEQEYYKLFLWFLPQLSHVLTAPCNCADLGVRDVGVLVLVHVACEMRSARASPLQPLAQVVFIFPLVLFAF